MSKAFTLQKIDYPLADILTGSLFIASVQKSNGEIPWSRGGKTDPWDHIESAMGLTVGGLYEEAKRAYLWSSLTQLPDGSWWSCYEGGKPRSDAYKDSNMTAYIAVGVLHYFLATGDFEFLRALWPAVVKAVDYVTTLQGTGGEVFWARRADGSIDHKALLTGSSSIYMSLTCALKTASILGEKRPSWEVARMKLGKAIRYRPQLFDRTKSRYSMDWYYPVLCGVFTGKEARRRIQESWNAFAIPGWGVRCVLDRPWLTMAETSELVIALAAMGEFRSAEMAFAWIQDKKYDDGAFWTGLTFPDGQIYTREKTTWTAAAVLLAADLLFGISSASRLFSHAFWKPFPFSSRHHQPLLP